MTDNINPARGREGMMGQPTTLDAVQKGDMVTVFPSYGSHRQSTVARVTKHQIIVQGGDHYDRHFGALKGDRGFSRAFIAVGPEAEAEKADRTARAIRTAAAHTIGVHADRLNQATVTTHRGACDQAERALRQLGEWNDAAIDAAQPGRE